MYKSKKYTEKSYDLIASEIDSLARYSETRRVFIADGDALGLNTPLLLKILEKLKFTFPKLRRISIYGNALNILKKTDQELESLSGAGLSLIYLGLESGSDLILGKIKKGVSKEEQELAITRAENCGLDVSATIVTGLGGKERWKEHIEQSADLVNTAAPKHLSTLSLMLPPDAHKRLMSVFENRFTPQDDAAMLEEAKLLISLINSKKRIIFRSNHASNTLALRGTLPRDKESLVNQIDLALASGSDLRPHWLRGF